MGDEKDEILKMLGREKTPSLDYRHFVSIVEPFIREMTSSERYECLIGFEKDARFCDCAEEYFLEFPTHELRHKHLTERIAQISMLTAEFDYDDLVSHLKPSPDIVESIAGDLRPSSENSIINACLTSANDYVSRFQTHHARKAFLSRSLAAKEIEHKAFERLREQFGYSPFREDPGNNR